MIKKLLPFEKLVYHSSLTKEELLIHLQNEIEAEKSFGFGANNYSYSKPYIGKIDNNSFEIKRAINYRNSFLPKINGEIHNDSSGSRINVTMNVVVMVKVFMLIWLSVVIVGCLVTTYIIIFNNGLNSEGGFFMLIPYFMLLIGVIMISFGFKIESKKSIKDLEEMLKAKLIDK
ncbi:hypothetical protein HNQ02_000475 [Flavobacterium sp. 7E]|uniref:hypothetical protein n=1 Tax=Flavobacterium sp. 7E TaxID=2735898 RepID=UPI00156F7C24|nr:hypothetical protein [Flavobacterium sp. 7E]NRS87568.1 hypothetical protein [Flavobacterium sp. 7E]